MMFFCTVPPLQTRLFWVPMRNFIGGMSSPISFDQVFSHCFLAEQVLTPQTFPLFFRRTKVPPHTLYLSIHSRRTSKKNSEKLR